MNHKKTKKQLTQELKHKFGCVSTHDDAYTGRHQSKEIPDESDKFLKTTIDGLSSNIAVLDENGYILFVNKTWREFARENGLDPKDVSVGTNYLHVCDNAKGDTAAEAVAFAAGIRSVLDGKKAFFMLEYPCHSPTEKRWFVGRITPFPGNGPRRVIVSHEDITKRKLAKEALEESERRYNQLAEQSLTITWEIDSDGIFTFVSPVAFAVIGYKPEEIATKMHFFELHPELGREEFTRLAFSLFARKESFKDLQHPIQKKSGDTIFVSTSGLPLLDRNGDLLGYRGSYADITERKRSEQEIALRERRFQDLVEHIPNYIVRYNKSLQRIYVNPAWTKASGFSAEEATNPQNTDATNVNTPAVHGYIKKLREVLNSGNPDKIEFTWTNVHGLELSLRYFLVPEFGKTGAVTGVLAIGHDLTDRKKRNRASDIQRPFKRKSHQAGRHEHSFARSLGTERQRLPSDQGSNLVKHATVNPSLY